MVTVFLRTSFSPMRAIKVIMDTGSAYNISRCSMLPLGWQRLEISDYKILLVEDANRDRKQNLSPVLPRMRPRSAD